MGEPDYKAIRNALSERQLSYKGTFGVRCKQPNKRKREVPIRRSKVKQKNNEIRMNNISPASEGAWLLNIEAPKLVTETQSLARQISTISGDCGNG